MTHETETGFGSGLRAQLERKLGIEQEVAEPEIVVEQIEPTAPIDLQNELEDALGRERQLREALQHQVEAYERELAAARDLALREARTDEVMASVEAARAEAEEREVVLRIQLDQLEADKSEIASKRMELVAEEARLAELARHVDSRSLELESAGQQRAHASAHLAQQLATIAERERELKREQAALDARAREEGVRVAAREDTVAKREAAALRRDEAAGRREAAAHAAIAEVALERERVQERETEIAAREAAFEKRYDARERMLSNSEAALAAREKRIREHGERLERERAGHGQASQEAFALLAELERREERVHEREAKIVERETVVAERSLEVEQLTESLRVREARLGVDLDLREDVLDDRERALAGREALIAERERDLTAYVGEIQGQFTARSVA